MKYLFKNLIICLFFAAYSSTLSAASQGSGGDSDLSWTCANLTNFFGLILSGCTMQSENGVMETLSMTVSISGDTVVSGTCEDQEAYYYSVPVSIPYEEYNSPIDQWWSLNTAYEAAGNLYLTYNWTSLLFPSGGGSQGPFYNSWGGCWL